jgi:hypothetical protein
MVVVLVVGGWWLVFSGEKKPSNQHFSEIDAFFTTNQ